MAETGKDRSRRIDTNYHHKVDAPVKLKRGLGLIAALLGITYAGYVLHASISQHRSGPLSTGDLSQAHSAWNSADCENCHTPNVPIRTDALWGTDHHHIRLNNQKCVDCHETATGHFTAQTQDTVRKSESCSTCHREHLGLEHDLARVDDSLCVRCHADLAEFSTKQASARRANVTSFSSGGGHPDFRSLKSDPGTIAFSHTQHMRPGQPVVPGDKTAMTWSRIPEKYHPLYADLADGDVGRDVDGGFVQLDCTDCHQPDNAWPNQTERPAPMASAASDHRFYKPIDFERHCAACHELPFELPHGLNRQATHASLEKYSAREALKAAGDIDRVAHAGILLNRAKAALRESLACIKCHQEADPNDVQLVTPSKIPARWFEGAAFSHGAHKDIDCARCHKHAYEKTEERVNSRRESSFVMIGGLENCTTCHVSSLVERAQRIEKNGKHIAIGGCVECHPYHVDQVPSAAFATRSQALTLVPNEANSAGGGSPP